MDFYNGGGVNPPVNVSICFAIAKTISSRHGLAATCTPIGNPISDFAIDVDAVFNHKWNPK